MRACVRAYPQVCTCMCVSVSVCLPVYVYMRLSVCPHMVSVRDEGREGDSEGGREGDKRKRDRATELERALRMKLSSMND